MTWSRFVVSRRQEVPGWVEYADAFGAQHLPTGEAFPDRRRPRRRPGWVPPPAKALDDSAKAPLWAG